MTRDEAHKNAPDAPYVKWHEFQEFIEKIYDDFEKPCVWDKQPSRNTTILPNGGVYIKSCDGSVQTSMVDIKALDKDLYCGSCGHKVKVLS